MIRVRMYGAMEEDAAGNTTNRVHAWFSHYNDAVKCQLEIGVCKVEDEYTQYHIKELEAKVYETFEEYKDSRSRRSQIREQILELQEELKALDADEYSTTLY